MIKGWRCGALAHLRGGVSSERRSNGTRVMEDRARVIDVDGGMIYCSGVRVGGLSVGEVEAVSGDRWSGGGCSGLEGLSKILARNVAAATELSMGSGSFGVEKVVQRDDKNSSESSGDSIVEGSVCGHVRGPGWGGARPAPSDNEGAVGVVGSAYNVSDDGGGGVGTSDGGGGGGGGVMNEEGVGIGVLNASKILLMASSGCTWPGSCCVYRMVRLIRCSPMRPWFII